MFPAQFSGSGTLWHWRPGCLLPILDFSKLSHVKFFWHQNSLKNVICKYWGKVERQEEVNQSKEEAGNPRLCPEM